MIDLTSIWMIYIHWQYMVWHGIHYIHTHMQLLLFFYKPNLLIAVLAIIFLIGVCDAILCN